MQSIIIFVFFSFCCLAFGELEPASDDSSYLISSILYGDYDRECPKGHAVTDFQFKLINSTSKGNGSVENDGSNGENKQDISLKGHCSRHIDDNALTMALAANKINDTSSQCRYGEFFSIQGSVTETDYSIMCKPGEYIGGAASKFSDNQRRLKLKCCQAPGALTHEPSFGCYNMHADKENIKSLINRGSDCPVDVLTGVQFTNGANLIGRYCSLSVIGLDYKNTTCKQDRQRDILASQATTFVAGIFTLMVFCTLIFARNIFLD